MEVDPLVAQEMGRMTMEIAVLKNENKGLKAFIQEKLSAMTEMTETLVTKDEAEQRLTEVVGKVT